MTEQGEEMTLTGEYLNHFNNVSINKNIIIEHDIKNYCQTESRELDADNENHHESFQMIFVLKGKLNFIRTGETSCCAYMEANQHNLCYIVPEFTHLVTSNPGDEVVCINLSRNFLNRYFPPDHPVRHRFATIKKANTPTMLSPFNLHITPEIKTVLQRLESFSLTNFCDQLLLESKAIELLALQLVHFENFENDTCFYPLEKKERERMQQARDILINHTGEQLSLRALAHLVGTNEFNLKRDFKAAFGNTVYGYLKQHRMEQAKKMLLAGGKTIASISKKMGYKHATHFTSAFKKYFGYLPNKIRSNKLFLLIFSQDFSVILENLDFVIC